MIDGPDTATLSALLICATTLLWGVRRRRIDRSQAAVVAGGLDTQLGWSPRATRVLRGPERAAFSVLSVALPECLVLAQVPVARFVAVPRSNSRVEWMRRLGSQCVDFVICDQSSRVISVVEIRPPISSMGDPRVRRVDRIERALDALSIPVHVWDENELPSPEAARSSITTRWPAGLNLGAITA